MELIRGLGSLGERHRGSVVTIGTYDGIHLGHQALLARLKEHGERLSRPTMVLTFEPMPREYLAPQDPPPRLTSLRERWRVLERIGIDYLWLLRFGARVRSLSGEEFAGLLASELRTGLVVVGHDFRFGKNGAATVPLLERAGAELGFAVDIVPAVSVEGERVSSSGVREALASGNFARVCGWLGRPYAMMGRVVQGNQLGRTLGFPTANLRIGRRRSPLQGIFAVKVHGVQELPMPGVASLGVRPTVAGKEMLLEAHLFDFAGDLYGREISVEFVAKLRDEEYFPTLDALVEQMHRDAAAARRILGC